MPTKNRDSCAQAMTRARWALIGLSLTVVGCGPRSDRLEVSGQVTLDGVPLSDASIRFTSVGDQNLMSSGALIRNGEYLIPQEKGLKPGTYHLEITSPDSKAPPVMMPVMPGGQGIPVAPERIPPEYNLKSDKTVEVTVNGPNKFDFAIVSKPAK